MLVPTTKKVTIMGGSSGGVRIVSRRLVRPASSVPPPEQLEVIHLTPWDLRLLTIDYIQKGILLPKPPTEAGGGGGSTNFVDDLASSFARTLGRFYPFAGHLVASDIDNGGTTSSIAVSLRCSSDEGAAAEFVHAVAPGVTASDITTPLYIPSVVRSFFPLNGVLSADAVLDARRPLLAAQVTELEDGVFVAVSLNHAVADGTAFWHFMNTWSETNRRRGGDDDDGEGHYSSLTMAQPVFERWFIDTTSPVPIPLPIARLQDIVRRPEYPPVRECFLHFSGESVKKLKAQANAEIIAAEAQPPTAAATTTTTTISSLQSLLAHVWRGVCRARRHAPDRETTYTVLVGCRARVKRVPAAYTGNAVTLAVARSATGDVLHKGLGWAALLLNRAVASFGDEASIRDDLAAWHRDPRFMYLDVSGDSAGVVTGSSPRFDVYGNDFGWGRPPLAVRSGAGNKTDGKVTVYEGRGGGGSMGLEVCLSPEALARLVADEEFMEAVSPAPA